MHTVVVGGSLAGMRTVQALRGAECADRITVVGAESHLPYDRPPLSKDFLFGTTTVADIELVDEGSLADLDIDLRLGVSATALDVAGRCVVVGSERIPYDRVVIATGSVARRLPGTEHLDGVHTLRTIEDAMAIRAALASGARVAVVGGGFIGAEVACGARQLGLDVTVIDTLPALMIRGLGPELGGVLARRYADHGVRLQLGHGVERVTGGSRVERVVLDDGSAVDADLVVVGIGVEPAVGWLAGSGLDVRGGLACDAHLCAGDGVFAVGDVARWSSRGTSNRYEHWTNAVDQASVVASVLTGGGMRYEPTHYVWSDQLGTRLQVWGEIGAEDEVVYLIGDADAGEFVAACGSGGYLHGVVALGARRDALRVSRLLSAGAAWEPGVGPVAQVA
jgi:NADPH-dependent 2,4-dienoyl-CoA reductase/sulfur reductase-like enzyme